MDCCIFGSIEREMGTHGNLSATSGYVFRVKSFIGIKLMVTDVIFLQYAGVKSGDLDLFTESCFTSFGLHHFYRTRNSSITCEPGIPLRLKLTYQVKVDLCG